MSLTQRLAGLGPQRPPAVPIEMPTASNPGRYGHDGDTRLINCYPEQAGREGKSIFPLYAVDGLTSFATLTGNGACRGMFATENGLYVVNAQVLDHVDINGNVTTLGGIPGSGPVYFARNRATPFETIIVSGGNVYRVVNTTTFAQVNDPDLEPPTSVAFVDGRIIYGINNGKFFYSDLDDADAIDALSFAEAEGSPDGLQRVFVLNRNIWMLGDKTTEVWESTEDANNPFQRQAGAFFEVGCVSPGSVVELSNRVAWISDQGQVIVAGLGGTFERISTHAVERAIDAVADKTTIEGFVYERRGHEFYHLSASTFTWVFDTTTGSWHERQSQSQTRWRGAWYAKFEDKHIVGDAFGGTLYELDPDTYDENGADLIVTVQFPIHAYPRPIRLDRLFFDMIPGQGLNSADPDLADPQLMLRLSRNGGRSYGNEMTRSIGAIGEYGAETHFRKLGRSKEDGFICQASAFAAVVKAFTGIAAEVVAVRRAS